MNTMYARLPTEINGLNVFGIKFFLSVYSVVIWK